MENHLGESAPEQGAEGSRYTAVRGNAGRRYGRGARACNVNVGGHYHSDLIADKKFFCWTRENSS